jgi:hypothetical protein
VRLKFAVKRPYGRADVGFPLKRPHVVVDAKSEHSALKEVDNRGGYSQNIAQAQFPRVKRRFCASNRIDDDAAQRRPTANIRANSQIGG